MSRSIMIQILDDATADWIAREAERRGISEQTLILELIRKGIGTDRESQELQTYHDLDSLAGTWSDEEAKQFLDATADFEQVDEKLWR
ncbi:MAG: hypothetical protein L0229_05145 [Blastocatellia bacterium]|nr:hypothetical protein [Blastocatellia bacterium]